MNNNYYHFTDSRFVIIAICNGTSRGIIPRYIGDAVEDTKLKVSQQKEYWIGRSGRPEYCSCRRHK